MNKTIIALAIAAALPVTAAADMTISGTLNTKYKNTGVIDTDARLSMASSEVLANGMTATAAFAILADHDDDTENQGTATLTGDFGALTIGEIDSDGAFQAGDVAGIVSNTTYSTSSTAATVSGIHYAGSVAGLTVAAQINAKTGANAVGTTAPVAGGAATGYTTYTAGTTEKTSSTQMAATYEMNGLTVGYSYASAKADDDSVKGTHDGVHSGQSVFGVAYSFGDLVVSAGKQNLKDGLDSPDAVVSATYTMAVDNMTIVAQTDNSPSGDYQIDLSYALSDSVTLTSEIDSTAGKETTMVASYSAGNVTTTVAKQDDATTDASISLDLGAASLTIGKVGARGVTLANPTGSAEYTHVSYNVSF